MTKWHLLAGSRVLTSPVTHTAHAQGTFVSGTGIKGYFCCLNLAPAALLLFWELESLLLLSKTRKVIKIMKDLKVFLQMSFLLSRTSFNKTRPFLHCDIPTPGQVMPAELGCAMSILWGHPAPGTAASLRGGKNPSNPSLKHLGKVDIMTDQKKTPITNQQVALNAPSASKMSQSLAGSPSQDISVTPARCWVGAS